MPPLVEFYNVGSAGVVKDTDETPPEAWTDGRNVRFFDNKAQQVTGYDQFDTSICAAPNFAIAVPQQSTNSDIWVYCGDTDVYAYTGSANAKLTASSLTATGINTWSGTLLSGILVLNTQRHKPQYWVFPPNTGTTLSDLPDWSASWTCKVIRSYKNYLVALHTTEKGTDYPYRVRWSHAADAGTVPTSWDASDTTLDAGYNDLLEGGDFVIDGAPLGDKFIIYKENSVWATDYIGGTLIFKFTKLFSDWGLLSRHAIAPLGRSHFCVGQNEIYLHDGFSDPQPLLSGRMRRYFYSSLDRDNTDKVFCVPNHSRKEIWVTIPDSTGLSSKALIWNYDSNTWSVRDVPELSHASYGGVDYQQSASTWNGETQQWNQVITQWDVEAYKEQRVILVSRGKGKLYIADEGWDDDGTPITAWLERKALPLDGTDRKGSPKIASTGMVAVRGVWPRMRCNKPSEISIWIGTQDHPIDTVTWYGPYRFNPVTMQKVDCRVTGRFISIKFQSSDDMAWTLESFGLDIHRAGMYR